MNHEHVIGAYEGGDTANQIARQHGVCRHKIDQIIRHSGVARGYRQTFTRMVSSRVVLEGYASGLSLEQVGKRLGVSGRFVANIVRAAGAMRQGRKNKPKPDIEKAKELYFSKKMTLKEVADSLGCCDSVLARELKKHGLQVRSPGPCSGKGQKKKLTLDVEMMARMYTEGEMPLDRIAERFSCSVETVRSRLMAHGVKIRKRGPHHLR